MNDECGRDQLPYNPEFHCVREKGHDGACRDYRDNQIHKLEAALAAAEQRVGELQKFVESAEFAYKIFPDDEFSRAAYIHAAYAEHRAAMTGKDE